MARKQKEYALYKGDELLGLGTIKELSEKLKVLPETVYFIRVPHMPKEVAVRIEECC